MSQADEPQNQETGGRMTSFVNLLKAWLVDFEVNSQIFAEMMNDEELSLPARTLAAAVLIYIVSPLDIIPDTSRWVKILGMVDDVIVMVVSLSAIVPLISESRLEYYRSKYQAVNQISEYVSILKSVLGILWDGMVQFVDKCRHRRYQKQTAQDVVQSANAREDLFDQAMIRVAELNLNPDVLDRELAMLPPPEKMIGLLADGIQKDKDRQSKPTGISQMQAGLKHLLPSGRENKET